MKIVATLATWLFLTVTYCPLAHSFEKTAKFTVVVVDDGGNPVENANVGVGFERNFRPKDAIGKQAKTDSNGMASFSELTSGYITYGAKKEGYYNSHFDFTFSKAGTFRWDPWNPELKVILRKIKNPVPMYARRTKIEIPVAGKEVGFDFVKYDWVIPYGNGTISDFTVYLDMDDKGGNDFEYEVKIYFPKKYDGFYTYDEEIEKGSSFKLQRLANTDGYNNKEINVLMVGLKRGSKLSWKNDRHYIVRVRSEEKNGKFIRGMYGKIFSDIKLLTARKTGGMPSLSFTYYLNPDYTRNLEFDPKRNLFGNLPDLERVTEP